jgi:acylaminoacyl-peptidase
VINRLPFKFDGAGFLKDNWRHLFVIDAEGGAPEPVTTGEYNVLTAAWSPDNRKIVYVANKDEKIKLTMKNNLWLFNCRTKEHTLIPIESRVYDAVSCSPNGKWIAYIGNTEKFGLATKNNLFAYNTETGEELTLTEKFDLKVGDQVNGGTGIAVDPSPVWTPDSESVYFLTAKRGNGVLFKATLDHKVEQVSDGKNTIESYSFSANHKILAFLTTNMTSPSEIWISEGGENKKLTRINDEFTNQINLIHGNMFTFKASDGVPVDGWFYKPVNTMRERCPVILILKGGPHSSCWGKGGYGEEFAKTARAKYYGERDYKDLIEAIDFILEKYPVDGEKLGVTGYSRGGFLTNWVISHTNRFKAAVTAGGFCDVYSFFGTSDEMHIWCEKNYEGTPWDDEELYMSKSPIRYVEKINTPTMIIHAQQDYRAPMSQAEQLYFSLKRLGKEAEMVIFPGESHSLPRRSSPKHMIEYQQHVLRWFKRFMPP